MQLRTFAIVLVAALQSGCDSACLDVQQVLCECTGRTQDQRNACSDSAKAQESLAPPDEAALAQCDAILPVCEELVAKGCAALDTDEGKRACGLAR